MAQGSGTVTAVAQLTAVAWVQFLAWELIHATGLAKKKKKKMAILPEVNYRLLKFLSKFQVFFFFAVMKNPIFKFICNYKGLQIAKTSLKKKNKARRPTFPNFKTYLQSHSNQKSMILA